MVNLPHKVRGGKYFDQQYSLASTVPAVVCVVMLFINQVNWNLIWSALGSVASSGIIMVMCMYVLLHRFNQEMATAFCEVVGHVCYAFFYRLTFNDQIAWFVKGAFRNLLRPLLYMVMYVHGLIDHEVALNIWLYTAFCGRQCCSSVCDAVEGWGTQKKCSARPHPSIWCFLHRFNRSTQW